MNTIPSIKKSFTDARLATSPGGKLVTKAELKRAIGIGTQNGVLTTGERVAIEKGWEQLFRDGKDGASLGAQEEYRRVQKALGLRPHKLTAEAVAQTTDGRAAIKATMSAAVAKQNAASTDGTTYSLVLPKPYQTTWTVRVAYPAISEAVELYFSVEGEMVHGSGSESEPGNHTFDAIAHATPKGLAAAFKKAFG